MPDSDDEDAFESQDTVDLGIEEQQEAVKFYDGNDLEEGDDKVHEAHNVAEQNGSQNDDDRRLETNQNDSDVNFSATHGHKDEQSILSKDPPQCPERRCKSVSPEQRRFKTPQVFADFEIDNEVKVVNVEADESGTSNILVEEAKSQPAECPDEISTSYVQISSMTSSPLSSPLSLPDMDLEDLDRQGKDLHFQSHLQEMVLDDIQPQGSRERSMETIIPSEKIGRASCRERV